MHASRSMYLPVSMTPAKHVTHHASRHASSVSLIPGSKYRQLRWCQWHRQCMHCRCRWYRWCISRTFGSSPKHLKEQSVKKQAISRYYFSIASVQSSKESSNYNKIVYFALAQEKLNISANIRKKSKSLLGLSTGARRSCLKKKTRGEKSGVTVPLRALPAFFSAPKTFWHVVRPLATCVRPFVPYILVTCYLPSFHFQPLGGLCYLRVGACYLNVTICYTQILTSWTLAFYMWCMYCMYVTICILHLATCYLHVAFAT
jgi:hypothetical protein